MEEHLSREQRFSQYEQNGACTGTGYDKERKAFALLHTDKTLACGHGYYKSVREGKCLSLPPSFESYFERCTGGRLYKYQKALGIKLRL